MQAIFMKRKPYDHTETTIPSNNIGFRQNEKLFIVGILALPFLILYWLVPFVGKHTIGNDYLNYWINMQMYLRFSLANGTFPLYAPGFNGGWTSSALTLGQMHHPIFWLAAVIPGYWDGYAHEIGTLLRFLSLGGTQVVIFLFLRRLRLATATCVRAVLCHGL